LKAVNFNLENIKRILIVNPFGIGDVLFTTPLIRNLRNYFKSNYIAYLCNERTSYILENNPFIDEVFVFEKDRYRNLWKDSKLSFLKSMWQFYKTLRRRNFDLCIDLSLNSQYGFFIKSLNIPVRIGFDFKGRGRFLTHRIKLPYGYKDKHVIEYYLDILKYLNIGIQDNFMDFFINSKDMQEADNIFKSLNLQNKNVIGVCPGAGASWGKQATFKHWDIERFADLVSKIIDDLKIPVLLLGSLKERRITNQIKHIVSKKGLIDLGGKTRLGVFASLIKKCLVVISNDGGPIHIATSLKVPTISIFGPVDEKVYGPYPPSKEHIVIKKDLPCRPCYKNFRLPACNFQRKCLTSIEVEEVFNSLKDLVSTLK